MDIETIMQGGGLVIGGAAMTKIGDWLLAWLRSRNQKTEIVPTPLDVEIKKELAAIYASKRELAVAEKRMDDALGRLADDNARDHENIFARLNANDKLTSKLEGLLEGIREDLKAIKEKMFRRK